MLNGYIIDVICLYYSRIIAVNKIVTKIESWVGWKRLKVVGNDRMNYLASVLTVASPVRTFSVQGRGAGRRMEPPLIESGIHR